MIEQIQLYDDRLGFEENKARGPFGEYKKSRFVYENRGEPGYDFFGIPVYSPFGIAAGPLPSPRFIAAALNHGFDIVTLKSVRTDEFPLNAYPHVRPVQLNDTRSMRPDARVMVAPSYNAPLAVANSFGIPSVAPIEWQPDMRHSLDLPGKGQVLLAAFQGTARGEGEEAFVQDHVKGVGLLCEAGATIIEINLSCPNEGKEALACFDSDMTERIVIAVRSAYPHIKLIIKLAYFSKPSQLRKLVKRVGPLLDGISAINTMPMLVSNTDGIDAFPGRPTAGISGAPIKWAGLEMVRLLARFRRELELHYTIIGMGGVLNAQDFHDYREAGADIVMAVTGAMWNSQLAAEIKIDL